MSESAVRTLRGIQQSLLAPPKASAGTIPVEALGAVFTKRWVVDLLLDLAGYRSDVNLVDQTAVEPSAGEGAFLRPMIERLVESCRRLGRDLAECKSSLIAFELNENSGAAARSLARSVLIEHGVAPALADRLSHGWVRFDDYLLASTQIEADFVIGNPPYVRLENIPDEIAKIYREAYPTMRGRADLYIAFFEAALRQLKIGGVCAFICADRWMRNQYGADLRELVTSYYSVDVVIEMHQANAFHDEVDAYPAITVLRRTDDRTSTIVAKAGAGVESIPVDELSASLLSARASDAPLLPAGLRAAVVDEWFKGSDPWPCQSPEQLSLLRRLEQSFSALSTSAKVGIGVATGNDGIFITKDASIVEPSRLLKLGLASDISSGSLKWSGHYLIDPWNDRGLVDLGEYPRMKAYFESHEEALKRRHTAQKNLGGWYKTIDRVTHVLKDKPKLYIADIKDVLDPVLDSGETYPHHNLYFVASDEWDLEILGGILMSALGQFFVESYGVQMRGGYFRFQAQYLRRIRVPNVKAISPKHAKQFIRAFRERDRSLATQAAIEAYGLHNCDLEAMLGDR
jgi:hypothetical protein